MREIFSNSENLLAHYISLRGVPTEPEGLPIAKIVVGSDKSAVLDSTASIDLTVTQDDIGVYSVIVPRNILAGKRYARVEFSYEIAGHGPTVESELYVITRRVIGFEEVMEALGVDDAGDQYEITWTQYSVLETSVRKMIETYCLQDFSHWKGAQVVYGPPGFIFLPQYMEKLDSVSVSASDVYLVTPGSPQNRYVLSESGTSLATLNNYQTQTIFDNNNKTNVHHTVSGTWGYATIPPAITEAAMELIRIYMVDDFDARRKFLSDITNDAQISVHFNWGSYVDSTGNPVADYLLKPYRMQTFAAI